MTDDRMTFRLKDVPVSRMTQAVAAVQDAMVKRYDDCVTIMQDGAKYRVQVKGQGASARFLGFAERPL